MVVSENLKILLAEDNPINQRLAALMINMLNLKCDLASNGQEAYDLFQQKQYDLILMDMNMPVMSGMDATRLIRRFEQEAGRRRAYIVALSASEIFEGRQICLEAGMDEFMEKPLREELLLDLIARISA